VGVVPYEANARSALGDGCRSRLPPSVTSGAVFQASSSSTPSVGRPGPRRGMRYSGSSRRRGASSERPSARLEPSCAASASTGSRPWSFQNPKSVRMAPSKFGICARLLLDDLDGLPLGARRPASGPRPASADRGRPASGRSTRRRSAGTTGSRAARGPSARK
jgi:hypothetical protein